MDAEKRNLEDKAAMVCFALSLSGMLGALYAYSLGKKAGQLTLSTSGDSVHLPADEPEDADDSPDPAGDE
jgi:hypothetical protein